MDERLRNVIALWRAKLGDDAVDTADATLARYGRTLQVDESPPVAVLLPSSTDHVQATVRIAAEHGVPLHPISRGKNWGYGSAAPPGPGQAVVDLGRLNRIHEVNTDLAYAVVEPGVTQRQLYDHLQANAPQLWMDASGAGWDASIVGNTLDRGFGHTPAGDHFLNAAGLEIVMPDGELLRTGYGHFPNAQATHAYRYGVGPVLDGLFSQSNLGIVTRIGVWLNPAPETFCAFFASTNDEHALTDLIDRLRPLRLSGMLRSAVHVANDLRVMSARIRYPFDRTNGATLMPPGLRASLRKQLALGAWNVSGGIYGPRGVVAATRKALRTALRGYRLIFLDDRKLALAKSATAALRFVPQLREINELLGVVEPAYNLLKGIPSDEFLRGVLWQSKRLDETDTLDPLEHDVGLIWVSPVTPSTGEHAQRVVSLMEPIFNRHGFDYAATLTFITERALCFVTNISFDRGSETERQRAKACYDDVMQALLAAGYPPYRTGPAGHAKLHDDDDVFWQTCRRIKQTLDPNRIISPGRYIQ